MVKKSITMLTVVLLAACDGGAGTTEAQRPDPADVEAARAAAMTLGKSLKGRLVAAMQEGGPVAAISVCNLEAPEIAARGTAESGYLVGRTSTRIRNPENAPDPFELAALEKFRAAIEAGTDPATIEFAEIALDGDAKVFRYMKPIMVEAPCIACPGASLSPDVQAAVAERYPDDAATGYELGDFRGAFSISKTLD